MDTNWLGVGGAVILVGSAGYTMINKSFFPTRMDTPTNNSTPPRHFTPKDLEYESAEPDERAERMSVGGKKSKRRKLKK